MFKYQMTGYFNFKFFNNKDVSHDNKELITLKFRGNILNYNNIPCKYYKKVTLFFEIPYDIENLINKNPSRNYKNFYELDRIHEDHVKIIRIIDENNNVIFSKN